MSCSDVPRETALVARFEVASWAMKVLLLHCSLLRLLKGDHRMVSTFLIEF